ncbi:hypothetical protein NE237_006610 [Protea cynaroides]|uniref:Uncharacterized protein n=1 Tax=Protea cynaroides TaxID=273540 RepID=A0A9Q0KMU3_9MAGN|nr:hypothetical protein NE237_006610 [Protea cynaroides]
MGNQGLLNQGMNGGDNQEVQVEGRRSALPAPEVGMMDKNRDDLGKFLGFPSQEPAGVTIRSLQATAEDNLVDPLPPRVRKDGAVMGKSRIRKHRRWTMAEKGKAPIDPEQEGRPAILTMVDDVSKASGQQRGGNVTGGRTFASVTVGLPDLSSLPEPVATGSNGYTT